MSELCGRAKHGFVRGVSAAVLAGVFTAATTFVSAVRAEEPKQFVPDIAPLGTSAFYTFTGANPVAISKEGNIVRYESPIGFEHIGIGAFSEGYVLCYGSKIAYDVAESSSGFGPATATCSGSTCTVTRNTVDGVLRLKQTFTKGSGSSRTFDVAMTVTNLTAAGQSNVILRRQVDFDVDTGGSKGTLDFENHFGASEAGSVFAWNPINASTKEGHAMFLSTAGRNPGATPTRAKVTEGILDTTCSPVNIASDGPVFGDYGATIQFNYGTLPGKGSVGAIVRYDRQ